MARPCLNETLKAKSAFSEKTCALPITSRKPWPRSSAKTSRTRPELIARRLLVQIQAPQHLIAPSCGSSTVQPRVSDQSSCEWPILSPRWGEIPLPGRGDTAGGYSNRYLPLPRNRSRPYLSISAIAGGFSRGCADSGGGAEQAHLPTSRLPPTRTHACRATEEHSARPTSSRVPQLRSPAEAAAVHTARAQSPDRWRLHR